MLFREKYEIIVDKKGIYFLENIEAWFVLKSVKGIGNHLFKRLIKAFGSPDNVFQKSEKELTQVEGISKRIAGSILHHTVPDDVKLDMELVFKHNINIITLNDENYPPLLRQIDNPPPLIYAYGNIYPKKNNIAFVGSRSATEYGVNLTKTLCRNMAEIGFTIVSGMARGIDTCAHEGALEVNGKTIAVLGSGLKNVYPRENLKLFYRIIENGAVISEFPLMAAPEAHHFPARNRIISGLCLGTVVVEAGLKSGSLITANLALEQNREVFAVPGSINSFKSAGSHKLIKQGAKLVENIQDILDEIPYELSELSKFKNNKKEKRLDLTEEEETVLSALSASPVHIDSIIQKVSIDMGKLLGILLQLELKGMVEKSYGNFFKLIR